MAMNTAEVKQALDDGDYCDAYDLLTEKCPSVDRRFNRLTKELGKLLNEVKVEFPDAIYYTTGGDGFSLLLGESHSGRLEDANHELSAISATGLTVHGGDW